MSIQNRVDKLKELVEKLRKNDLMVPKEDLEGKYKKPYQELKEEIKQLAEDILNGILTAGLLILKNAQGEECLKRIKTFVDSKKAEGIERQYGICLFKEYDVNKFMSHVNDIKQQIDIIYKDYRCKEDELNRCFDKH